MKKIKRDIRVYVTLDASMTREEIEACMKIIKSEIKKVSLLSKKELEMFGLADKVKISQVIEPS